MTISPVELPLSEAAKSAAALKTAGAKDGDALSSQSAPPSSPGNNNVWTPSCKSVTLPIVSVIAWAYKLMVESEG